MIKFVDESRGSNHCLCTVLVSCTVMYSFVVKRYAYTFLVKKIFEAHNAHHFVFMTRFSYIRNSVPYDSHMDGH